MWILSFIPAIVAIVYAVRDFKLAKLAAEHGARIIPGNGKLYDFSQKKRR